MGKNQEVAQMVDLLYVTKLSIRIHDFDMDKAYLWMITPNEILFGKKPYETALVDAKPLIKFLEERIQKGK
jgi:hypothetical protein